MIPGAVTDRAGFQLSSVAKPDEAEPARQRSCYGASPLVTTHLRLTIEMLPMCIPPDACFLPLGRILADMVRRTLLAFFFVSLVVSGVTRLAESVNNSNRHPGLGPFRREPPPQTLATDCTLFASATGTEANNGKSPNTATTFQAAANAAHPGDVVCVMGGTYHLNTSFYPPRSGRATAWIRYKAYGDSPASFVWTGRDYIGNSMFNLQTGTSFPHGYAYLEFDSLTLDGNNLSHEGFFCRYGHHLKWVGNVIRNAGQSGIASVSCDYLTADRNLIYHNGYGKGGSSGISYNGTCFYDHYRGLHNIISNNIVSGSYDGTLHTDGNGITMDLSCKRTPGLENANTPPGLIFNNIVYENGGRCIIHFSVTDIWTINNTCYKNGLDTTMKTPGEIDSNASYDLWFANNIVVSWRGDNPPYYREAGSYNLHWHHNLYYGARLNFTPSAHDQFLYGDPKFVNPPRVDPTAPGQYQTALPPDQLGDGLMVQSTSPAIGKAVDAATLPGIPPAVANDLRNYLSPSVNNRVLGAGLGSRPAQQPPR